MSTIQLTPEDETFATIIRDTVNEYLPIGNQNDGELNTEKDVEQLARQLALAMDMLLQVAVETIIAQLPCNADPRTFLLTFQALKGLEERLHAIAVRGLLTAMEKGTKS